MRRGAGAPRAPLRVRVRPARALAPLALAALLACAAACGALAIGGLGAAEAAHPAAAAAEEALAGLRAGLGQLEARIRALELDRLELPG